MRLIYLLAVVSHALTAQTTTTLAISPNPVGVGQPTTFTAGVSPSSGSGFVAFMEGNSVLATAPIQGGQAVARYRFPLPGVHSVRAVRDGSVSDPAAVTVPSTAPVSFGHGRSIFNGRFVLAGRWYFLDMNRDGIEDAVFVNPTEPQVLTALGTGNPAKPMSDYIVTQLPGLSNVRIGDVSGDGYVDLAVNVGGSIDFWLGDGSGRFLPSSTKIAGSQDLLNSVEANGDGVPDFVVRTGDPRSTAIWLSAGSGVWSLATIYAWADLNTDASGHALDAAGDFNGDGRSDFVVRTYSRGCRIVLASGANAYTPTGDWFDCGGATVPSDRYFAEDVNRDGRADLLYPTGDNGPNAWRLRLASPAGTMGDATSIPLIAGAIREDLIGVADWDLDGKKDIVSVAIHAPTTGSSEPGRSYVRIRKGDGAGQFTYGSDYVTSFVAPSQFEAWYHLADWNGDGFVDLITSDRSTVEWQIGLLNVPPQPDLIFIPGPEVIVGRPHAFEVSASDGNGNLRYMRVVFGKTPTESGGCSFEVDLKTRTVRMDGSNRGAISWPAVLQNSFCAIDVTGSAFGTVSGKITAFAPLVGINKLHVRATDESGLQSGWREGVPVNVVNSLPVLPAFATVSPLSGSSLFQTLTATLYDPNGANEIRDVLFLVNDMVDGSHACLIHFDVKNRRIELFNDAGTGYLPSGQTSNEQCTIRQSDSVIVPTFTSLRVSVPVAFTSRFHGDHRLFLNAVEISGASTGWLDRGAFSVRSQNAVSGPGTRSLTPEYSSFGEIVSFTAEFTHSEPSQHYIGYIFIMQIPSPVSFSAAKACILEYNRISNSIRMINDAGTGWSPPRTAGTMVGPVSNSQCSVEAASVTAGISGEVMTVRAGIQLRSGYTGPRATFLQALDASGRYSGVRQFGYWSSLTDVRRPGPFLPVIARTSTEAGSETAVSFAFGPTALIEWATVLISDGISNPGCQIYYFPKTNLLRLVSDDGTALLAPVTPQSGGPAIVSNSRCSVDASSLAIIDQGVDSRQVSMNVRFYPATFSGRKNLYSLAISSDGLVTHWRPGGSFDVQ